MLHVLREAARRVNNLVPRPRSNPNGTHFRVGWHWTTWYCVLSPVAWLPAVLLFGLPWWALALPLPVPFIDGAPGFHFDCAGIDLHIGPLNLYLYWMDNN